jgi:hypothetical protein
MVESSLDARDGAVESSLDAGVGWAWVPTRRRDDAMMCALVVRRLKPGTYEAFRRAWEPAPGEPWHPGLVRTWMARSDDDPNVVATWTVLDLDLEGLDAARDDPEWMRADAQRRVAMAELEEELVISSYFEIMDEILPPTTPGG